MSKINLNNPIKILLPISLEIEEFKMQEKMNHLAKKNLASIAKKFLNDCIIEIHAENMIGRRLTDKERLHMLREQSNIEFRMN